MREGGEGAGGGGGGEMDCVVSRHSHLVSTQNRAEECSVYHSCMSHDTMQVSF